MSVGRGVSGMWRAWDCSIGGRPARQAAGEDARRDRPDDTGRVVQVEASPRVGKERDGDRRDAEKGPLDGPGDGPRVVDVLLAQVRSRVHARDDEVRAAGEEFLDREV